MKIFFDYFLIPNDYFLIPNKYTDKEIIVRILYSPYHINSKKNKVKPAAFHPPSGKTDISILRHNFTTTNFCKKHGKRFADLDKKFQGFGAFRCSDIKALRKEGEKEPHLIVSKIFDIKKRLFLPMHGDIIMGQIIDGEPPKIDIRRRAKEIQKIVQLFVDSEPDDDSWKGKELKLV